MCKSKEYKDNTRNILRKSFLLVMIAILILSVSGCSSSYKNSRYISRPEYKNIQIPYQELEAKDEELSYEYMFFLDDYAHDIRLYEGEVLLKDTANIDYSGTIAGKPFEGGADKDYNLTIGSNTFIEGFEESLVGVEIGSTVDIEVVFPEDYKNQDGSISSLAGKPAIFSVNVHSVLRRIYPDTEEQLEIVQSLGYSSIQEYEDYLRGQIFKYNLVEKTWEYLVDSVQVKRYPKAVNERVKALRDYYEYYMEYYGYYSFDEFVQDALGQTEEEFEQAALENAQISLKNEMIAESIASMEKITLSKEETEKGFKTFAEYYGYTDVEDFLESYDKESLLSSMLLNKVMEHIAEYSLVLD